MGAGVGEGVGVGGKGMSGNLGAFSTLPPGALTEGSVMGAETGEVVGRGPTWVRQEGRGSDTGSTRRVGVRQGGRGFDSLKEGG